MKYFSFEGALIAGGTLFLCFIISVMILLVINNKIVLSIPKEIILLGLLIVGFGFIFGGFTYQIFVINCIVLRKKVKGRCGIA